MTKIRHKHDEANKPKHKKYCTEDWTTINGKDLFLFLKSRLTPQLLP